MLRCFMLSRTERMLLIAAAAVVCAAPLAAQVEPDAAAKVLVMKGQVSVLRNNYEWALNTGSAVQPREIVVTGPDGYAKFQISDGSTFEVFPSSRVTFREHPASLGDLLNVWLGRVKVYIQHMNGPNPNRVTTQTAVVSVRGTVFDVQVEDADATTLVSVDEGVVSVLNTQQGGEAILRAGESIRVYKNQPLAMHVDKSPIIRGILRAAQEAIYEAIYHPASGTPAPGGVSVPSGSGGQGDKGRTGTGGGASGGTGGTNTGTTAPAPPPPPPSAPPPPPPPAN
ncbi:MAG TPA: FecR family protein [Bryobacteraceae bacterium]|nr:FecR family protein [Bryobacteraceae bacterium]